MQLMRITILSGMLILLTACASAPPQAPQIRRISPEELERIMPRPVPNLSLDEIVRLSRNGVAPELIIEKIKTSNSRYDLTPSQVVDLSKRGVDARVLDYIHSSREQALRDGFADEINKREKAHSIEQQKLRQEYELRSYPYYDPFWGYPYGPYGGYPPFYGPGFRYYHGW